MRRVRVLSSLSLAILVGVGLATFRYAEGRSYLSTDPAACANCHIMWPQYDSWLKSSHQAVAGCADCHLPHDFPANYIAKAVNGWNHSRAFTLQDFHEPIMINEPNSAIRQRNGGMCHAELVHAQPRLFGPARDCDGPLLRGVSLGQGLDRSHEAARKPSGETT